MVFPVLAEAQTETVIRVDPQYSAVDPGQAFTVDVRVENVQNLAAFDVTLNFNPRLLKVNDLTMGDFLDLGFWGSDVDNENGLIHFYNAILSHSDPGSGSGVLFTVHFTAKTIVADTRVEIDEVWTELVEDETYQTLPYSAQDGFVQIVTPNRIFMPLVIR